MNLQRRYNKTERVLEQLRGEIARGDHGNVGMPFMTIRDMADVFQISLVTAQHVATGLKNEGILVNHGKRLHIASREIELTANRSHRFGVLVTNIDNPFFSRLLNAIELSGRRRNIEIISAGSNYDLNHEESQLAMLQKSGADGFLICPAHDENSAASLRRLERPFVLVGRRMKTMETDVVMVQNFEAGRLVANHLIERGCQDFVYVGVNNFSADQRRQGFCFELHERGINLPPSQILSVDCRNLDHVLPLDYWEKLCRSKRVGVFCFHDLLALRILRQARISRLKVPQQLSIVGFDNLPIASEVFPSLSSVEYPIEQIAENAVELLLRRVNGGNGGAGTINYLHPELIIRESSFEFGKVIRSNRVAEMYLTHL